MKDEIYIKECIELAQKGIGKVSPNPLVGCVIVKDGKIISRGYHSEFGKDHAEVNAIKNAKGVDLTGATVYVNLEPCSIYSKTPPCCDLLIEKKVSRVVCGTKDYNPLINGNGIKKLRKAGIDVKVGVLKDECLRLNEKFFKYVKTKMPYVTLKIAQTLDGKISSGYYDKNKISSLEAQKYVHRLRLENDAILVGSGTIKKDNPYLTLRHVKGRQPYRVILNSNLDISLKSNVLNDDFVDKTILIVSNNSYKNKIKIIDKLINKGVRVYPLKLMRNDLFDLNEVLELLGEIEISSVLVEGGSKIFTQFVLQKCFDEINMFISPKIYGKGIFSIDPEINKFINLQFKKYNYKLIGDEILFNGKI